MIAHLTDIHIGKPGELPRGVPVRENYLAVLREITEMRPELLVITGDIGLDIGDREIYEWVRGSLEETSLRYLVLPGNHDKPELLAEVFGSPMGAVRGRSHRVMEAGGEEIVLFDVSSGDVTGEDLDWLAGVLARRGREEVLLFMHYPPVRLPIAHMERNYALAGREKVSRVMEESQARLYIFCGHYHNELSQERRGYSVFLTPSTYFQIDPMDEEFSIEHHRPGWRFIDRIDGYITTGVRYRGL